MTKVEVFFEVTADDPDLALSVLEMLNKGAKAQWGKKPEADRRLLLRVDE
jgi:hypothetical protein